LEDLLTDTRSIQREFREREKHSAIRHLSSGKSVADVGRAKYRIGGAVIHVRFCSQDRRASAKYKFNINPNTLTADYELWICGSSRVYYLIPIGHIKAIYDDPTGYPDRHHEKTIKVVSVDTGVDRVTFGAGGKNRSLTSFRSASL
jgi:hypothetical protein